jgi:hypothetical protein
MVPEDKEKVPIPVNYRRAVNSPMWALIVFLALKWKMRPNTVIDTLVQEAYKKEITKNG